jgi:hypothetical protein
MVGERTVSVLDGATDRTRLPLAERWSLTELPAIARLALFVKDTILDHRTHARPRIHSVVCLDGLSLDGYRAHSAPALDGAIRPRTRAKSRNQTPTLMSRCLTED